MSRFIANLVLATVLAGASGCIVHRHPIRSRERVVVVRECRPHQYWDGETCRHKGKGHGARKHDGR